MNSNNSPPGFPDHDVLVKVHPLLKMLPCGVLQVSRVQPLLDNDIGWVQVGDWLQTLVMGNS